MSNGLATAQSAYARNPAMFATTLPLDRLVRKEVALGLIREIVPPQNHIGLNLCPWLPVQSDDVIFDYAVGLADGLAPARAEDAESELAQKDDTFVGQGRAAVVDWALKDHYSASDVNRYREFLDIAQQVRDSQNLPLTVSSALDGWAGKMARDTVRRSNRLNNRIEWLIMTALNTGVIAYNDGKIKFTVDFGRPAAQESLDPGGVLPTSHGTLGTAWGAVDSDPIGDILKIQQWMYDTYAVRMTRILASHKTLTSFVNSTNFAARTGLVVADGTGGIVTPNPQYVLDGWGPNAALQVIANATGVQFIEYDSVYRTRPIGSNTVTNNRFFPQNRVLFLPDEADVSEFDDTQIGFCKTLTSPHPAGNWGTGFYEWERDYGVDPWGHDVGSGVKAFPVFPHMDLTVTYDIP